MHHSQNVNLQGLALRIFLTISQNSRFSVEDRFHNYYLVNLKVLSVNQCNDSIFAPCVNYLHIDHSDSYKHVIFLFLIIFHYTKQIPNLLVQHFGATLYSFWKIFKSYCLLIYHLQHLSNAFIWQILEKLLCLRKCSNSLDRAVNKIDKKTLCLGNLHTSWKWGAKKEGNI